MKNYFQFNLTGKKVLPVWIAFVVLFLIPYILVQIKMQTLPKPESGNVDTMALITYMGKIFSLYGVMMILLIVQYAILFFIGKLAIEGVELKEKSIRFVGTFGRFLLVLIPGFLLTIITFGIYGPWYTTNLYKFFAKNSSHDDNEFEFAGKGSDLFLIMLFTVVLPMIFFMIIAILFVFAVGLKGGAAAPTPTLMTQVYAFSLVLLVIFFMIPYIYYTTKWTLNLKFKNYSIQLETELWESAKKIALEVFLSAITLGIYTPLASLKLFKYFSERTVAMSENGSKKFGYDIEPKADFLFIWGQYLLTLITLGIYCPWAFCKTSKRILAKTYVEDITVAEV
jgi:uncharacterized membrane protein YjgN (DUF898 family)